jgi:hypothetical protein
MLSVSALAADAEEVVKINITSAFLTKFGASPGAGGIFTNIWGDNATVSKVELFALPD